jgi:hypothetical protein
MAKKDVITPRKVGTIFNELDQLHNAISRRAYDLFRNRRGCGVVRWQTGSTRSNS